MKISNGDAKWVVHPDLTLGDVREHDSTNECSGRGSETAAARGYNTERLAAAVFSSKTIQDKQGVLVVRHNVVWKKLECSTNRVKMMY